jgi:endonuclease I
MGLGYSPAIESATQGPDQGFRGTTMSLERGAHGAALCLLFAFAAPSALAQYVSLVGGTPSVQDFNTLAASGIGTTLPDGWYLAETGGNANATYAADNGVLNAGNTYSYGANASSERALGMLRSGSLASMIGARLRNDTAQALNEIAVSFTGEQWRLGGIGRSDRIAAQYSLDATSLGDSAATWVNVVALDFTSPVTTGTVGALDGNLAANRSAVSGSITGLALAPNASLWLRWVDMDVSGADDGLAIDDVSFAVAGSPPVDNPPSVTSTTPLDNAVDVALDATIAVTFSEPVAPLAFPWFSLNCVTSGTHAATASGGPTTYTLTPASAFAADEDCTWTIFASEIVDEDGTPDHLASDTVVAFHTRDPSNFPPGVASITPAEGASNVPSASTIGVTFSEAVTTSANAFALACDSNAITLGESGSGATRTLTPASALPAGANCTLTISASAVQNGFGVHLAADVVSHFSTGSGGGVGDYYAHVNTSSPDQLRCSLHLTIRGHTAYPYSGSGTNTWTILETAQANPANAAQILDVYRNHYYTAVSDRAGTGSGITYNREHTWPNSLGFPTDTGNLGLPNAPYTDTHMLYLSDTQWNADRGNKPYADCATNCGERATEANGGFGGGSGVYPGNSNWTNNNSFQTWNHRKGEVARAVMYMAIRYEGGVDPVSGQIEPELELTDDRSLIVGRNDYTQPAYMGLLGDLLTWNQDDPPDDAERARDEVIYSFQGNRNPFVDHPEWATRALFESVNPPTCELASNDVIFANGFDTTAR